MKLTDELCNHLFELLPLETKRCIISIATELESAMQKHKYWPADAVHAAAIVCEESGELIRAALQYNYEDGTRPEMDEEAVQTAATCLRFLLYDY